MLRGVVYDKEEKVTEPELQKGVTYDTIDFESISLPGEVWYPVFDSVVPYVQPYYYISNFGRLYSTMYKNGVGGIRKINPHKDGYIKTTLRLQPNEENRDETHIMMHRLVMLTFDPQVDKDTDKLLVNHKDGNKSNNRVDNLEWCTNQENIQHAYGMNLINSKRGEQHHSSTHTDDQIHKICQGLEKGLDLTETAIYAGIEPTYENRRYISRIKQEDIWTHISSQYNIPKELYYNKVFTDLQAHEVCLMFEQGMSCTEVATATRPELHGKDRQKYLRTLYKVRDRLYYTDISKYYNF